MEHGLHFFSALQKSIFTVSGNSGAGAVISGLVVDGLPIQGLGQLAPMLRVINLTLSTLGAGFSLQLIRARLRLNLVRTRWGLADTANRHELAYDKRHIFSVIQSADMRNIYSLPGSFFQVTVSRTYTGCADAASPTLPLANSLASRGNI